MAIGIGTTIHIGAGPITFAVAVAQVLSAFWATGIVRPGGNACCVAARIKVRIVTIAISVGHANGKGGRECYSGYGLGGEHEETSSRRIRLALRNLHAVGRFGFCSCRDGNPHPKNNHMRYPKGR